MKIYLLCSVNRLIGEKSPARAVVAAYETKKQAESGLKRLARRMCYDESAYCIIEAITQ